MTQKKDFDPSGPAAAGSGVYGLPKDRAGSLVHLIPVPWEATTSYLGGTARGPRAILEASRQLDLYDIDTGRPYESGIFMHPESAAIKKLDREVKEGTVAAINRAGAKVNDYVRKTAAKALDDGKLVGVVGGDHSSPYGLIAELAERHPGMGILHIDAHHDLREAYEGYTWSHASIMHNVMEHLDVHRLVQVGVRDFCEEEAKAVESSERRIVSYYDKELALARARGLSFDGVASKIALELPDEVYVSFDIDGLDPKLCPGTGTPVPGGLDFNDAIHLLRVLVATGHRIVGFDLSEVGPGEWDGNVGARILYKLIGFALQARRG